MHAAAAAASESFAEASRSDAAEELVLATALPLVASALPEAVELALLTPLEALMKLDRKVRVWQQGRSTACCSCRSG